MQHFETTLLTRRQAAELVGVSVKTLYNWEVWGWLTPVRVGRSWPRYTLEMLRDVCRRQQPH